MTLPPSPRLPAALQLARFVVRPVPFMEQSRRSLGGAFTVRLPRLPDTVVISDPASIKALFAADRVNSVASRRNLVLAPIVGDNSLLLIDGDHHLSRRRLMLPPFHGERMRAYEQTMVEATEAELARWPTGEPFPLQPAMQSITLEVIMRAVFGVSGERREELRSLLLRILAATRSPLAIGVALPVVRDFGRFREMREAVAAADRLLLEEIAERRADPDIAEREDILSMLVAARDEEGEGMHDGEIRDQLMTLLLAGHETTATSLAWAFDLLFRDPGRMARLRAEVADGGHEYLDAVSEETLRLRPVVPFVGRDLKQPATLGGHDLPAGVTVLAAIYLAHTDPESFPEPYAFRPERFLEDSPETYSWIPFGGGTRRCIGAAFAQLEMRVVLRTILSQAELAPGSAEPERIVRRNVTLAPEHGTPAVLERRTSEPVAVG
jgi:cytochrome P450 family 135